MTHNSFIYKDFEIVILSVWLRRRSGDCPRLAVRPGFRCWMVSKEETRWSCLCCWHSGVEAHLSAILFWSASSGRGVAVWKQRGFRRSPHPGFALNAPCNPRLHLCHLVHSCLLFIRISAVPSPPLRFAASFLSIRKTLVSGKQWSSCHFCFSPPSPAPSHCCRPQLCMCFTAAVKDKKQSLPPPLLFSGRMSLPFL